MNSKPVLSCKLMELPPGIIYHILSFLSDENPQPPANTCFGNPDTAKNIPLPGDLLPLAQSSRALGAAVADLLGPRAVRVGSDISDMAKNRFVQWITVLAPFLKAITTGSSANLMFSIYNLAPQRARRSRTSNELSYAVVGKFLNDLCDGTFQLLKSISADNMYLEVLELVDVPFYKWKEKEDELLLCLVRALERNCESLKQLGLPVADLCARALARVTLRNLRVMKVEMHELRKSFSFAPDESVRPADAFLQMLQALDGHADRSRKANTLQELSLLNIKEAPCMDITKSGCTKGLFDTIKTLRLDTSECSITNHEALAIFVMLFRNLECLHSNGLLTAKNLRLLNRACPNVREFHLRPELLFSWGQTQDLTENNPVWEVKASQLARIFAAGEGKFKTLVLFGKPTERQIKVLGEKNAGLEHLGMQVGGNSVVGLGLLLGNHCRQIRKLELMVFPDIHAEGLGRDGWRTLTEAICSASDKLCEVTVELEDDCTEEEGTVLVLESVHDVIEFLGERARMVVFSAASDSQEDFFEVLDALCRILRTCSTKGKNLSVLKLDVYARVSVDTEDGEEQYKELYRQFLRERRKLSEEVTHLSVRLHSVDTSVQRWLDQIEV